MPGFRGVWVASLTAALVVTIAALGGHATGTSAWFIAGAAAWPAVAAVGLAALGAARVRRRGQTAAAVALLGPAAAYLAGFADPQALLDAGPTAAVAVAVVVGTATVAIRFLIPRLRLHDEPHAWAIVAGTAAASGVALCAVHLGMGTLIDVRPGRTGEHVLFFVATWGLALVLVPIWSQLGWTVADLTPPRWATRASTIAAALIALVMLRSESWLLPDFNPLLHVWWLSAVVVTLAAALVPWMDRVTRPVATIAAVTLLAAAGTHLAGGLPSLDLATRARVAETAAGRTVLRHSPTPAASALGDETSAPTVRRDEGPHYDGAPMNVVLITIDTLRPDAIDGGLPPRLHALAAEAAHFTHAYAAGSNTRVSLAAFVGLRYAAHLQWTFGIAGPDGPVQPIDDPRTTRRGPLQHIRVIHRAPPGGGLAVRLAATGLATAATLYGGHGNFFRPGTEFTAGIEHLTIVDGRVVPPPSSAAVADAAIAQLTALSKPDGPRFFHWVHLYDPHESGVDRARYRDLVLGADAAMGRYLDALGRLGHTDDTAVVVVSDHGEAFGEHGLIRHGGGLYDEQVRVPLVIRVPGQPPRRIDTPVSILDAATTVLSLAGADLDDCGGCDGVDLWPAVAGLGPGPIRPVFIEQFRHDSHSTKRVFDLVAVVDGDDKLIYDRTLETLQLFDLGADPTEDRNLVWTDQARVEEHARTLQAFIRTRVSGPAP